MRDYAVVNPATAEAGREYATASDQEIAVATTRAATAHGEWSSTTVEERVAFVRKLGEMHSEHREHLAAIIVREMGKPIERALDEVDFSAAIYGYYADRGADLMADEEIDLLDGDGSALIRRTSLGVLLGIMPWNFPYYQVARFAAPNLVIGNTLLLKHAPQCPESAEEIEKICRTAGLPSGVYNNIYATVEQIAGVIADPRVQGVSLTGSERAGAAVAELAGRHLKKVVLELGGSDPFLVLSTDDLDTVVGRAVQARLQNSGQACTAAKRFIVIEDLYDSFLEKFAAVLTAVTPGDPSSSETTLGPLSSSSAAARLAGQVEAAVEQGATVVAGGGRDGNFFSPTVLTDITPDNDAYREEFFGPVAQVYKVASEGEAIALANDTTPGWCS